jgi:hypothetical protein
MISCSLICVALAWAQATVQKSGSPAKENRTESYQIYSSLIPLGETASSNFPHSQWLVQDKTIIVVPADKPCVPAPSSSMDQFGGNPHLAVHPPAQWQPDFEEILHDFDAHCHERLALDPNPYLWKVSGPVRFLTPVEQKEFQSTRLGKSSEFTGKYEGAPALYGFSKVYFNNRHTVALVFATLWCGSLCGQGLWIALESKDGRWTQLPWNATHWIS